MSPNPDPRDVQPDSRPEQKLFILKYKHGMSMVQTGYLLARDQAYAERVGHAFCDSKPGMRYVQVSPAILADETWIGEEPSAPPAPVKNARATKSRSDENAA